MSTNDIGKHLLADIYGVDPTVLADESTLMALLDTGLKQARFTILDQLSYTFPGGGGGVTGMFLLSESHAAFHTYPEIPYIALDIFSCGASEPEDVLAHMVRALQPQQVVTKLERRGKNYRSAVAPLLPLQPVYERLQLASRSHSSSIAS